MSSKTMNYWSKILVVSSLAMLSACDLKADEQAGKSEISARAALTDNKQPPQDSTVEKSVGCVRGQAEPIIKKNYFPATSFVLQPDSMTGVETVRFKNGDKLIITNWGCESYVLTFRFETSRFRANNSNLNYWYAAAGELMNETVPGVDAPVDIKAGVRALKSYAAKNARHLRIRTELDFGGGEAARIATFDTIAKMPGNRTEVVLSFTAGLL
ncbi:hypothetical protein [Hymenobacter cheonanensis]|uniref:hypothetical protein n=1 Tax=Hymenobacter sp. CA2-7 TaxID=3063993 RepID=UPI002713487D|nr:hypothetical protein [Hymenobacter sp. CA2-7]MDO7884167.1 hypothetical protein [Hymenobacter sp. CA2-7]